MNNVFPPATLGELVTLGTDKIVANKDPRLPYVGLEHIAQGSPKLLGMAESSSSTSTNSIFFKDDILFGKLRPNLRKSIRASFAGYCSTDILVLRCREGVDPGFAGHVFQWEQVFRAASATAAGTKMPRTSWNELKAFSVFKPNTLAEQSRIAAVLDTVDKVIAKTEAVIAKLRQVRAGLLHDLLTRGLDEHGQLRNPIAHPAQFKDSPLGRIPKEWRVLTLNDVRATDTPITYGVLKPGPFVQEGIPLLQIEDVIHGQLDLTRLHRIGIALDAEYSRTRVYGEEIVISLVGTIGHVAQLPSHIGHANLHRNLGLLRIGFGHAPRFFLHLLRTESIQRQIRDSTFGSTQSLLNLRSLRALQIPVPQLAEQQRIQDVADSLDQQIDREVAVLVKFRLLKQGLMTDLLTGRVRVPESVSTVENQL